MQKPKRWIVGLGAAGIVGTVSLLAACSSLSKTDMQAQLQGLRKNADMGPLQSLTMTADLGDGAREYELRYYHAGTPNPDSLPVVLVHGTPSTLYSWSELIHGPSSALDADPRPAWRGLAETHEVFAIEVIGHGIAPGSALPYSFEKCARYVAAALEALNLERSFIVGTSYGGEFVWRAALLAPERVEGIVLFDASGRERREADWLSEEVEMRENPLADIGWLINSKERITSALAPHFETIPPDRVDEFFLVSENKENWKAMIDLAQDENGLAFARLANLQARALLVWGADDIAYPADDYAAAFEAQIPNAELHALPGVGHYPHEERTAEVLELMRAFMVLD